MKQSQYSLLAHPVNKAEVGGYMQQRQWDTCVCVPTDPNVNEGSQEIDPLDYLKASSSRGFAVLPPENRASMLCLGHCMCYCAQGWLQVC